jgi:hypothetical protein
MCADVNGLEAGRGSPRQIAFAEKNGFLLG